MKTNSQHLRRSALVALLLVVVSSIIITSVATARPAPAPAAAAAGGPLVSVDLWGEVMRGRDVVKIGGDVRVQPGEEITWRVRLSNQRPNWIANVQTIGDIPPGTSFVPGSAQGDGVTAVDYSIDGGQSYSPQPMIVKGGKQIPAPVARYTQVRLTFGDRIESGAVKLASYRTRVL